MEAVITAVEDAFHAYHQGKTDTPLRVRIQVKEADGNIFYMPSLVRNCESFKALGAKVVSVFNKNIEKDLPTIFATCLLNDADTGEPLALLEGSYLTGMRTGATSAVAGKYLARENTRVLGVIGAGYQAYFQIWAISMVTKLRKVLIYDPILNRSEKLTEKVEKRFTFDTKVEESAQSLVRKSEVLVTATTSTEPVFGGEDLREGTTVIAIGSFTPEAREVDDVTINRSRIYIDSYEGALAEAGDILIPMKEGKLKKEEIAGELGEVVTGNVPGRKSQKEIILFKSVGLAIEDVITAQVAYNKAIDKGIGTKVDIF